MAFKDWKVIYNNGTVISEENSADQAWNSAPIQNVQYMILVFEGYRKVFSGLDEYVLPIAGSNKKFGSTISPAQWQATRDYMIANT